MYSLRMSFWTVPPSLAAWDAPRVGHGDVEGQQDGRRGVDGHRRGHLAERQPVEQRLHVLEAGDRHPCPADLAERLRGVRVVAHLRGQVEGHRETRLTLLEEVAEALVGVRGGAEAGVLAHRPEAAAVHRRLDAARERELAGPAEVAILIQAGDVGRGVEIGDDDVAGREEGVTALGLVGNGLGAGRGAPAFAARILRRHGRRIRGRGQATTLGRAASPGVAGGWRAAGPA